MAVPSPIVDPEPGPSDRPPVGWIIAVTFGALGLIVGLIASSIGGFVLWAHGTQRDADGFFTSSAERFETVGRAITADDIDLGADLGSGDKAFDIGDLATVRITVDPVGDDPAFVGIGPDEEVEKYLDGVARARVEDVDVAPFRVGYDYVGGTEEPDAPADQTFWAVSAEGVGSQTIEWELESGQWSVVLMNADGSGGVAVDAAAGAKADWVFPLGLGVLGFGLVSLFGGAALLVVGAVGLSRRLDDAPAPGPASSGPVALTGRLEDPGRWLWLVKWILVIPHFIVLAVLWLAVAVVTFVSFFVVLFTGRYPRSLFNFVVGVLRWTWRVGFYSFAALGTDRYPPFSLSATPEDPATLDIAYPERLSQGLVLVKSWLLAIPHYIVLAFIGGGMGAGWAASGNDGAVWMSGGLLGILVLFAGLALLFSRRYPGGLFDLVMGLNRWGYRVGAYVLLLTDEYPPFRLDQGPDEPATPSASPAGETAG